MDYTKLPSQLVYRTRKSLEEFTNNNEMNECLVDNMLDIYYLQSSNFKERATACFNAAYYICTLILVDKHPEWSLPKYYDIAYCNQKNNIVGQAVVLSLVRVYLLHFDSDWHNKHEKLVDNLDRFLNSHWIQQGDIMLDDYSYQDAFNSLNSFSVATAPFTTTEFALRVIDQEAIEEMQIANFTWTQFTDYYKYNIMQDIVFHVGKTEDEMALLVGSLRHDAEHFYSKNNPYYESVCNRLGEIEQDIYFHFHGAENDALIQAEIEELQNFGDTRPLKARITELENKIKEYESCSDKDIDEIFSENSNQQNSCDNHLNDNSELKYRIAELEDMVNSLNSENTELREQIQLSAPKDDEGEIERLTMEKEDALLELLAPIFNNKRDTAQSFAKEVNGQNDREIIETVCNYVNQGRTNNTSVRQKLWSVLHAFKIYNAGVTNWNTMIRNRIK